MTKLCIVNRAAEYNRKRLIAKTNAHVLDYAPVDQRDAPVEAEYYLCRNTVPMWVPRERCILILVEPPLAGHRQELYAHLDQFHTVIGYGETGGNRFQLTDRPDIYPYNPNLKADNPRHDTTIRSRQIYYAGQCSEALAQAPDCHGSVNLYPARHMIGDWLLREKHGVCYGKGWPRQSKAPGMDWHTQKRIDCDNTGADFVLCIENSRMPGYATEKLYDGFITDRVVLYLGEPNIEEYVPAEAFVNLGVAWDRGADYSESVRSVLGRIHYLASEMSQFEYDRILDAARAYRRSCVGLYEAEQERITGLILSIIS